MAAVLKDIPLGESAAPDAGLGFAEEPAAAESRAPRMERPRKSTMQIDTEAIARRVVDFSTEDEMNRSEDMEARAQRYAKFRMWTEGKDWPWENASDAAIPDMMTHSLKVQDTLHNAVMSTRPSVVSKALQKANGDKEKTVNDILDFQFFVENTGELTVGEMADAFVNEGVVTVFVPWVKEERELHEIHTLPPIPTGTTPETHFSKYLQGVYKGKIFRMKDHDGWSWEVLEDDRVTWFPVEFYTVGKMIEMDAQKVATVFDAPRPMVKEYEDVLAPSRCSNLQIPSPSNSGGASHVILKDYPTLDEIKRLAASGFYDLPTDEEIEALERQYADTTTGQVMREQKDVFQGAATDTSSLNDRKSGEGANPDHKTLTRLTCFDIFDIDGDGVNEDVIWWVIKEGAGGKGLLLRARELTQVYPANPPRRPFAEGCYLPVIGRRGGISLLEIMEGLHDMIKQFADQTIDRATLTGVPFFFYRASSNMRPETIRLWPGEGYPLSDPKNDVQFPTFPQEGSAAGMNLMSLFGQMEERLTNIGDLQLGRVPQGKSSALRTVRGMQAVMGQGDARPERILRRFFMCLAQVYAQMHELNQVFLPRDKQYRVAGVSKLNEDPYRTVQDPAMIRGRFQFDFIANAMNTSKEAMQESLDALGAKIFNPLMIQLGIAKPEGAYQWARDSAKALGQDPDKYLTPPSPESNLPPMFAEEVISAIMQGNLPECRPAETNPQDHLKKLMEYFGSDYFGYLTPAQVQIFNAYMALTRQRLAAQAQQQQVMAAAQQFQQGAQGQGVPGPQGTAPIDTSQAPLQRNELADESLPGAGGGGNPTMLQ